MKRCPLRVGLKIMNATVTRIETAIARKKFIVLSSDNEKSRAVATHSTNNLK